MTSGPTDYPDSWKPRGAPQTAPPAAPSTTPTEAVALAVDAFVASLSEDEFAAMIQRTRGQ
jgi:hypothetical protein